MRHLFGKCKQQEDGSMVIPADLAARWQRQMNTPYDQLPQDEQKSDLAEADTILRVLLEIGDKC